MKINEIQYEEELVYKDNNYRTWKVKNESLVDIMTGLNICATYSTKELFNIEFEISSVSSNWRRVEDGDEYFSISMNGVSKFFEFSNCMNGKAWDKANYFTSEKLAKQIDNSQTLYRILLKFRDENDKKWNEKLFCDGTRSIYYVYYDHDFKSFEISHVFRSQHLHTVYFSNADIATRAMNEIVIPFCKKYKMFE